MPIEDDAWGEPVPLSDQPAPGANQPPPGGPSRRNLAVGGAAAALVAVIVVVVILVSGGGGGKGGGGSSGGLSKAAWIQKADAVCGSTFPQQAQDASSGNYAGEAALAQQTLTKIRALGLPSQGAAQVQTFENDEQHALVLLEQAIAAQNSDATTARNDYAQAQQFSQAGATAAGQFGMQVCSDGQGSSQAPAGSTQP